MSRKELKIGLFGFGCVGLGLYEVLSRTPALRAEVVRICVKQRDKPRPLSGENFTFNRYEILNDADINVVVELIDDAEAAFEIVSEALKKGKSVVSANKKMIAAHLEELLALQRTHGGSLLYEAACCASIPVIRNMEEYYDNDLLSSVEGIVNGSTNYILTEMSAKSRPYDEALKEAQALGFAESDPSLDVEGYDAAYKLQLLLVHAFGILPSPQGLFRIGISRIGEAEEIYAREKGYRIRLVARALRKGDSVQAYVMPEFVKPENKLFAVEGVFNGLRLSSAFSDAQFFEGKGAGAYPTASAVISDISALSYNYRYEYKKLGSGLSVSPAEDVFAEVFLSYRYLPAAKVKRSFNSVNGAYESKDMQYVTGVISLAALRILLDQDPSASAVLLQHQPGEVLPAPVEDQIAFHV